MNSDEEFLKKIGALPPDKAVPEFPVITETTDIKKMCEEMSPHVITELFAIALDGEASSNVRIQAGKEIIDRAHGKTASETPAVAVQVNLGDMDKSTLSRKLAFLDRVRDDATEIIDVEAEDDSE